MPISSLKSDLTQDELRKRLKYDQETGVFTWLEPRNNFVKVGDIANSKHNSGGRTIRINKRTYLVHRLVWLYMTGSWPVNHIDHIDRDPTNNRFSNLRDVQPWENNQNKGKRRDNKTGVTGVMFKKGKYHARICLRGEVIGEIFATLEEAAAWRAQKEKELHKFRPKY